MEATANVEDRENNNKEGGDVGIANQYVGNDSRIGPMVEFLGGTTTKLQTPMHGIVFKARK